MHKTFISYHHKLDQELKDAIITKGTVGEYFIDKSVMDGDINQYLEEETIMSKIRSEYIRDSTVVLVIIGEETSERPFINSEIQAALWGDNPTGLVAIVRDEVYDRIYNHETCKVLGCSCGTDLNTPTIEFKKRIPFLVYENHYILEDDKPTYPHFKNSDAYCSIYRYSDFMNNIEQYIDEAFNKRSRNYILKKRNERGVKTIKRPNGY